MPLLASVSAAGTPAAAASLALPRPAGAAPGHVLVASVSVRDESGAAAPAGWAEAVRTTCSGNDDVDLTQAVFVRVAAAGEPAAYVFTAAAATGIAGTIAAYAAVDTAAPVLAAGGQIRRNSRLVTAPSVTAPVAGALLAGAFSHTGRTALAPPAGQAARAAASATPDIRLLATDELRGAAGPTGDRTAASTQVNTCAVGQHVALRPAPDPPSSTSPPVLDGVAQEGLVLAATTGTWTWSPTAYAFQWQRGDGNSWADVGGATAAQHAVTAADVGARLRVVVTASNSGGSGSAASAPTAVVLPAPPVNLTPPAIAGDPVEQGTLTAGPGTWSGSPGFTLTWERSTDGTAWEPIPGADAATYEPGAADVGALLRVLVTGTNAGGSAVAASPAVGPVEPAGPPVPLQPPTVSGWLQEGETLSATTGTWAGSPTGFAYLWQSSADGSSWSDLGAGVSHVLGANDVGRLVRVVVTATNGAGSTDSASEPLGPIAPALPPAILEPPALVGVPTYGVPLQATTGIWLNAPREYAYRWLRSPDGSTWEPIAGATGPSYAPVLADVGVRLAVEVTASNASGSASATSAPSEPVGAPPPESVTPPVVSGDAVEGSTLSTTPGEWTNGPDAFAYAWERCDAAGCSEIRWATDPGYTLRRDDVGFSIRALVTASNPSGTATATSATTAVVLPLPPANEAAPVVTGLAAQGETLTVSNGHWYSATAITYAHRWQRSGDGGQTWVDVQAPAASTYTVAAADVGSILRAVVTATNGGGSTDAPSAPTVTVSPPGAPTVLVTPSVSGVVQERGRLNALEGTWSGSPSFAYAWQRSADGGATWANVPRGSSSRYTAVAADVGRLLRVRVTGQNDLGSLTVASESWLIQPVGGGQLHLANSTWYCNTAVDLQLVRVTIMDGRLVDAIRIDDCSGRIGRVEIVTNGIDGIKVRNTEPVAHDLTVEGGFVRCTGHPAGAHQDGIQVLGGSRVTFRNLVIWCGDPQSEFGTGVNSSALIAAGGSGGASTPTDIVIESSVMGPGTANGVLVEASIRSGLRNSVACPDWTPAGGPVLIGAAAVDGIDEGNEKPGPEDPRCSSFEAALAWAGG